MTTYLEVERVKGGQWFGKETALVQLFQRRFADYANMHNMHSLYK